MEISENKIKFIIVTIIEHLEKYFNEEIGITIESIKYHLQSANHLDLIGITSFLSLDGDIDLYIGFSFDNNIITKIFKQYTKEISIEEGMENSYISETANDTINIVIGNATQQLATKGSLLHLSPPITIAATGSINKRGDEYYFIVEIFSGNDKMQMFVIGPKDVFEKHLNEVKINL